MEVEVSSTLLNKFSTTARMALGGSTRWVHPSADSLTWRFGKLTERTNTWCLELDSCDHLPTFGELLTPLAVSDDGDALLVRDDREMSCLRWFHDDASVEGLQVGLEAWLAEAKRVDRGSIADSHETAQIPDLLLGVWKPTQVLTTGHAGLLKCLPTVEFTEDAQWTEHCSWPTKMIRHHKITSFDEASRTLEVLNGDDLLQYWYSFDNDGKLILAGPQKDFRVRYQRSE